MLVLLLLLDHIRSNPIRRNASRSLEWERYRRLGVSSVFRVDDEAPSVHWGYTTIRYLHSMCAGQCSRWTVGNRWDQHHQLHVNNKRPAKWFGINRSAALATETACGRQTARVRCALHRRFRWSAVQQRGDSVRLGYRSRSCPINGKSPRRLQHYRRIPEYAFFVQMGSIGGVRFVCQTKARFVLIIQKNIVLTENSYIYIYKNHIVIDRTPSFRCIPRTHRHVYAGTDLTLLQCLGHSDHYPRRNGRCLPQQTRSGGIFDADANAGQLRRNGIRIEWDLERIQLARWVYDLSHVGWKGEREFGVQFQDVSYYEVPSADGYAKIELWAVRREEDESSSVARDYGTSETKFEK